MQASKTSIPPHAQWQIKPISGADTSWWSTWDDLNREGHDSHPLLSSDMVRLLCKHFATGTLTLAALADSQRIYLQTILSHEGFGKWSLFNPSQAPIGPLVCRRVDEDLSAHIQRLARRLPKLGLAVDYPTHDPSYAPILAAPTVTHRALWGTTITVSCRGSFDEYWNARSKELRHNVRRYFRRIDEEHGGAWRLLHHETPEAVAGGVARYGELESRGWKAKEGTALHPTNVQGRFYGELLAAFSGRGFGHVFEFYVGDQLAASRLLIAGPTMYVILKTTYDESLGRIAPGRLLLHTILKELFAAPTRRAVEFYTRANKDTLAWSTDQRDIATVTVYRNRLVAGLANLQRQRRAQSDREAPPAPSSASDASSA
jgi:hypothetical protein